jgi:hypothetical protein
MLMFINRCHAKQFTCRAVVIAHSVISNTTVNYATHTVTTCVMRLLKMQVFWHVTLRQLVSG